jgi:hypothetical protein
MGSLPVQEGSQFNNQSPEELPSQLPEPSKRLHSDEELHCLYVGNKTTLTTAKKPKLVELYSYLIGEKVEECRKLTKVRLLELIFELVRWSFVNPISISINVSHSARWTRSVGRLK